MELAALDDRGVAGVGLDLQELRRRDAVAENVDLAALQAEEGDGRLLADLEGDPVELRDARLPVVGVALEDEALAEGPLGELVGAGADRMAAEVGANSATASSGTTWLKLSAILCRKVASAGRG